MDDDNIDEHGIPYEILEDNKCPKCGVEAWRYVTEKCEVCSSKHTVSHCTNCGAVMFDEETLNCIVESAYAGYDDHPIMRERNN